VIVSFADRVTEALYHGDAKGSARKLPPNVRSVASPTMQPKHRIPVHPGIVLRAEFLAPLGVTQVEFAAHVGVSLQRINEIVRGKRGVTPETAWLLAQALGTTPEFWVNLQVQHDLARTKPPRRIRRLRKSA
jgi:addiction module HigA family antidote